MSNALYETFCDRSYYDLWCVRKVGETRWGYCYHMNNKEEAEGLVKQLTDLERELAEAKVTAAFWLAHEKQINVEFERDYLAIWKAVKKPDLTVLESVLALVMELAIAKKDTARLDCLERLAVPFHWVSPEKLDDLGPIILTWRKCSALRTEIDAAMAEPK